MWLLGHGDGRSVAKDSHKLAQRQAWQVNLLFGEWCFERGLHARTPLQAKRVGSGLLRGSGDGLFIEGLWLAA